jgi:hypothetical protein
VLEEAESPTGDQMWQLVRDTVAYRQSMSPAAPD